MTYIPIIGMEVHVQPKTQSKMFCSCPNNLDEPEANKNVCDICLGHPGTLPLPNKAAIKYTVQLGKALGCTIRELSKFDRKHYFYPDLPKAYQISQYDEPIAEYGKLDLAFLLEENVRDVASIGIRRVHLEEDAAKLLHDTDGNTLVDFNRSGNPLIEIVTDPDFMSAAEAKKYCQELRTLLRFLDISDADLEKGHMRCEANISVQRAGTFEIVDGEVRPLGDATLNNKIELKNLNSFKAVERGIKYEIERQTKMIEDGEYWEQETRGWDEDKQETVGQRKKGDATDYRYFPEPDIPPFHPEKIAGAVRIPELPQAKRMRFHEEYGFSYADAHLLSLTPDWGEFTERVMSEVVDWLHSLPEVSGSTDEIREEKKTKIAKLAGGWMTSKLMGILKEKNMQLRDISFSAENFAELIALLYSGRVNSTNGYKILLIMAGLDTDKDPTHILEEKGWGQVSDEGALGNVIVEVIESYPKQVEEYKSGKEPVIKFLIGMVMKATEGSADPQVVEKLLKEALA